MLALGTWAGLPEYDRLLELLPLDDLLELLACDDPLECELECDDPLDEWEDPDDLLEDDDLDLSPLRDANEARGNRIHRVRPANLKIEFLGCNAM